MGKGSPSQLYSHSIVPSHSFSLVLPVCWHDTWYSRPAGVGSSISPIKMLRGPKKHDRGGRNGGFGFGTGGLGLGGFPPGGLGFGSGSGGLGFGSGRGLGGK